MTTEVKLTPKQTDVLRMLKRGRTPAQIGKALGITTNGVHGHIGRMRKLGVQVPSARGKATNAAAGKVEERAASNGAAGLVDPVLALRAMVEESKRMLAALDEEQAERARKAQAVREGLVAQHGRYLKALTCLED